MNTENLKFKAGEIIILTSGEYDDYTIINSVIAISDFNMAEKAIEFITKNKDPDEDFNNYHVDFTEFATFLVAQGVVSTVNCKKIQLGAYGKFSRCFKI